MTEAHSLVTLELSWATVGCEQQSPSAGASQSQQTLRFAIPGGSPNHDVSRANTLTPQGLILRPAGDAEAPKVRISLTLEGNFSQEPCLHRLFLSVRVPLHIYYSKSGRNTAFLDV